jgi:hypothetical protein
LRVNPRNSRKIIYSLFGLPRSGTTLFAIFFNSFENGFCLFEPHWLYQREREKFAAGRSKITDKAGDIELTSDPNFMRELADYLNRQEKFDLGGVKETFGVHYHQIADLVTSFGCDFNLFIFREPLSLFEAWKRTGWGHPYTDPEFFVKNYRAFFDKSKKRKENISLSYQAFSDDPRDYMVSRLKEFLAIEGELSLRPVAGIEYGDERARQSLGVEPPRQTHDLLSESEIKLITSELEPIYQVVRQANSSG